MFSTRTRAAIQHVVGMVAISLAFATVAIITFSGMVR